MNVVNNGPVTKELVFEIAERMMAAGKYPKLADIRAELGRGSYSTLTPFLQEWKAAQTKPEAPIRELAPAAIGERLEAFGGEIWAIAQEIATNRLKTEREALEAARIEMETQQAETAEMADQLAAEIEQLRGTLDETKGLLQIEREAKEVAFTMVNTAETELAKATSTLNEKEYRITELHEDLKHSRAVIFENQKERDLLLNKAQEERETLQAKINELTIQNAKLESKVDALQEKAQLTEHHLSEAKQEIKTLKEENVRKAKEAQEALIETATYKGQVSQLQKQINQQNKTDNNSPQSKNRTKGGDNTKATD